jgi:hypothetical protein
VTKRWEFRPERADTGDPTGSRSEDPFEPAHWVSIPWYGGIIAAVALFAISAGVLALAAWTEFDVLFTIAAIIGIFAFVPFFGGLASLFRTLFGARALQVSVVTAVCLIIVGCAAFLIAAAAKSK